MDKLYKIRTPTGLVIWNEFVWFVFSLPVKIDSWQDEKQHTFIEAVNATPSRVLADGTMLYGKPCILTVPVNDYALIRQGKKAIIKGRDIGSGLNTLINKMKANSLQDLYTRLGGFIACVILL